MEFKMLTLPDIQNAPEILIYFSIETLGDFLNVMRRAKRHGDVKSDDCKVDEQNAYHDQKQLVEVLKQRGFAVDDHEQYMKWYRWWNHWHRRTLNDDQWNELNRIIEWDGTQTEETFRDWRPAGNWQD